MITEEDIISGIVSKLRSKRKGSISNVVNNNNGTFTFNVSNTFDIYENYYINVGSYSCKIASLVANTSFTVWSATDLTTETEWSAQTPYFYYGNPIDRSAQIDRGVQDNDAKYPAVIMFEVINGDASNDRSEEIIKTPSFRLFFMNQNNYFNKTIEDTYGSVMKDMEELVDEFMFIAYSYKGIDISKSHYKFTKWSKWNVEAISNINQSHQTIFNNQLSGIEVNIDIPIMRSLNSVCKTDWRKQNK